MPSCLLVHRPNTKTQLGLVFGGKVTPATTVVDCDEGESINEALAKLDPNRPNIVEVSGTCTENIGIRDFQSLQLLAPDGATLNGTGPATVIFAVDVKNLLIRGFEIRGTAAGVGRGVYFGGCDGCSLRDSQISSVRWGIGIGSESPYVTGRNVEIRHVTQGVALGGHSTAVFWDPTIEGVDWDQSSIGFGVGSHGTGIIAGGSVIRGFDKGINVNHTGEAVIRCSPGNENLITGNRVGAKAGLGGQLRFNGPNEITGNGSAEDKWSTAIEVNFKSTLTMNGGNKVHDNLANGIFLSHLSHAYLAAGTEVTNNGLNGIAAILSSTVGFQWNTEQITTGNFLQDLYCSDSSHLSNVWSTTTDKVDCPNVDSESFPMEP